MRSFIRKYVKQLAAVLGIFMPAAVFASGSDVTSFDRASAIQRILNSQSQVINQMTSGDFQAVSDAAVAASVREGIQALRDQGYQEEANYWEQRFSGLFAELNTLGVGDHTPLFQALADFYNRLSGMLPPMILERLHLTDINTLNYTIPVVFQPSGDRRNGDHWDKMEYRRHFVPFSGIASYWAAYGACLYASQQEPRIKQLCGQLANLARRIVEMRLAPRLSDYVYDQAMAGRSFEYDVTGHNFELENELNQTQM